jgi:hypothetical protein
MQRHFWRAPTLMQAFKNLQDNRGRYYAPLTIHSTHGVISMGKFPWFMHKLTSPANSEESHVTRVCHSTFNELQTPHEIKTLIQPTVPEFNYDVAKKTVRSVYQMRACSQREWFLLSLSTESISLQPKNRASGSWPHWWPHSQEVLTDDRDHHSTHCEGWVSHYIVST